jgi:xylose isomerase
MNQQNKPVSENVILDLQTTAHARKQKMLSQQIVVQEAQSYADEMRKQLLWQELELGELADFLQEHNADALDSNETWRSRLGLARKPDES